MKIILLTLSLLYFGGCASIFSGTHDVVRIDSDPKGAQVKVNGVDQGVTPTQVSLRRRASSPIIEFKKEGYQRTTIAPQSDFNWVSVINLFFWPGWVIDAATGAMWRFDEPVYNASLEAATS